ncbi:MAG: DUF1842 domain-containing protein [Aliidongia sp.]|jgi:hypothetical protein
MSDVSQTRPVGLFQLKLQSSTGGLLGAPELNLSLVVYTPKSEVTGYAEVSQAVTPPSGLTKSHVHGSMTYLTVMGPGSKVRFDLTGYPCIHWPPHAGIGPVIPVNFKAIAVLNTQLTEGTVDYEWQTSDGEWHHIVQPIHKV